MENKPKVKCKINHEDLTYTCKGKNIFFKGRFIRQKNGKLKIKDETEKMDVKNEENLY